jgi:hypothetical protein
MTGLVLAAERLVSWRQTIGLVPAVALFMGDDDYYYYYYFILSHRRIMAKERHPAAEESSHD